MVRDRSPRAREPSRSWPARRSTMATSTPANASSPASISPVGPAPAMTTACSVTELPDWHLEVVQLRVVVPQHLALRRVGERQLEEGVGGIRILRVGVRIVGGVHD